MEQVFVEVLQNRDYHLNEVDFQIFRCDRFYRPGIHRTHVIDYIHEYVTVYHRFWVIEESYKPKSSYFLINSLLLEILMNFNLP